MAIQVRSAVPCEPVRSSQGRGAELPCPRTLRVRLPCGRSPRLRPQGVSRQRDPVTSALRFARRISGLALLERTSSLFPRCIFSHPTCSFQLRFRDSQYGLVCERESQSVNAGARDLHFNAHQTRKDAKSAKNLRWANGWHTSILLLFSWHPWHLVLLKFHA
jgi:hypothetical protein